MPTTISLHKVASQQPELRHLHHQPTDSCKLSLGPFQQYTGGTELYLDQRYCEVGTVISYYAGSSITLDERDKLDSRYT